MWHIHAIGDQPVVSQRPAEGAEYRAQDMTKLHGEVLQIVSQRFQLTTAALVFFATICSWTTGVVAKVTSAAEGAVFARASAGITIVVLALLFRYHASLGTSLRWLTTYLMCAGSEWEWHYYVLRRGRLSSTAEHDDERVQVEQPFHGYSVGSGYVFVALLVASVGYCAILEFLIVPEIPKLESYAVPHPAQSWGAITLVAVLVAADMLRLAYRVDNNESEARMLRLWQSIKRSCAAPKPDEADARVSAATNGGAPPAPAAGGGRLSYAESAHDHRKRSSRPRRGSV